MHVTLEPALPLSQSQAPDCQRVHAASSSRTPGCLCPRIVSSRAYAPPRTQSQPEKLRLTENARRARPTLCPASISEACATRACKSSGRPWGMSKVRTSPEFPQTDSARHRERRRSPWPPVRPQRQCKMTRLTGDSHQTRAHAAATSRQHLHPRGRASCPGGRASIQGM